MTGHTPYAGIDGCRAGWFCVRLGCNDEWNFSLIDDAGSLVKVAHSSKLVLIDIPVGLIESGRDERQCDRLARQLLGPRRGSSVFPSPARPALAARTYAEALLVNRRKTGRGISLQAWNIMPKIREIDDLLTEHRSLIGVLRESHPELCFWGLNSRVPLGVNKKKPAGREQRLQLLERYFPDARRLLQQAAAKYLRRQVAWDDIVDALANAVVARLCSERLRTIPVDPVKDLQGIPMEMVYWAESQ